MCTGVPGGLSAGVAMASQVNRDDRKTAIRKAPTETLEHTPVLCDSVYAENMILVCGTPASGIEYHCD